MRKYRLAVDSPFNQSILTYLGTDLLPGELVEVPLGRRKVEGCVIEEVDGADVDESKLKEICSKLDIGFRLDEKELIFYQWISQYYHYPLGQIIFESLPKRMKKPRDLKLEKGLGESSTFQLSPEQEVAYQETAKNLEKGFSKSLFHGVTGSGKSVVYLKLMSDVLVQKKSILFLIPEINLTPQFIAFFKTHLSCNIYSYHSGVTASDKYGLWKLLKTDTAPKLIIGVRSSIFLPIQNLGLIVVDEEHDTSFKQVDRCPYNARDLAIKKASLEDIPIVLGSATPTVETYEGFLGKKLNHFYYPLKKRALVDEMPSVRLLDMRQKELSQKEKAELKLTWPFHPSTIKKINEAFVKNEQVLVFINRLGYSNYLQCGSCGHQFTCPNCTTQLKYFRRKNILDCSFCDYKEPVPEMCPECMNLNLTPIGFGTERVQDLLRAKFPDKIIGRFDRDEITSFKQLEEVLESFHCGKTDLLVGTQMLSKGHNFKKVNLVVILGIDSQLNFPDFRSNERTYQTLVQVSGRSGRFGGNAEVVIQTLTPNNSVFHHVVNHSFDEFYGEEINLRKLCQCSPFKRVVLLSLNSKHQDKLINECSKIVTWMNNLKDSHFKSVDILGPRPSHIEKRVNKFNWSILLRSSNMNDLHNFLSTYQKSYELPYDITQKIDVDPYYID